MTYPSIEQTLSDVLISELEIRVIQILLQKHTDGSQSILSFTHYQIFRSVRQIFHKVIGHLWHFLLSILHHREWSSHKTMTTDDKIHNIHGREISRQVELILDTVSLMPDESVIRIPRRSPVGTLISSLLLLLREIFLSVHQVCTVFERHRPDQPSKC